MPIVFAAGDLLARPRLPALAHGCNCAGSMGGGIAAALADAFSGLEEAYAAECDAGRFELGDVFVWPPEPRDGVPVIFNLATQRMPGPDARLEAVAASLERMRTIAVERGIELIGCPQIGSGIGGLAWADVKTVMQRVFGDESSSSGTPTLVVAERFSPGLALRPGA